MDDWEDDFVVIEDKDPSNPQDSLDGAEQGIDSFNPGTGSFRNAEASNLYHITRFVPFYHTCH